MNKCIPFNTSEEIGKLFKQGGHTAAYKTNTLHIPMNTRQIIILTKIREFTE